MLRASATGRILDDDKDRGVAQTLLNYWATVLFRAGVPDDTVPVTSLAELEENAGRELDESQCPYCGLYAYSEATAHLFFGRKHVIEKWLESLRQKPLLVALGPSGSGKLRWSGRASSRPCARAAFPGAKPGRSRNPPSRVKIPPCNC